MQRERFLQIKQSLYRPLDNLTTAVLGMAAVNKHCFRCGSNSPGLISQLCRRVQAAWAEYENSSVGLGQMEDGHQALKASEKSILMTDMTPKAFSGSTLDARVLPKPGTMWTTSKPALVCGFDGLLSHWSLQWMGFAGLNNRIGKMECSWVRVRWSTVAVRSKSPFILFTVAYSTLSLSLF